MTNTMVIKLLGRNIGYAMLQNKVYSLWKPSKPFYLMDIKNWYFLAKFQSSEYFERVLSQGPWIIYGQYLTVQPWSVEFDPVKSFPCVVMLWIYLLELLGHISGRFMHMAIYVNLEKPLVSQVLINGVIQKIEYEYLPTVCFSCVCYGHAKEFYKTKKTSLGSIADTSSTDGGNNTTDTTMVVDGSVGEIEPYGPWMLVECRKRRNFSGSRKIEATNQGTLMGKSRINALESINGNYGSVHKGITRAKVGNKEVESNLISAKVGRSVQEGEVGSFNQARVGAMVGGPKVTRRLEGPVDLGESDEAHSVLGLREVAAPIAYGNITASYSFLVAHKGSEEVVNTIPSSKFNSSFSSNFNPMFERMLEVPVKMKEGVLDHSKHSDVIFKENVQPNQGTKMGDVHKGILGIKNLRQSCNRWRV
ncbi:hypothetical protein Goshw_025313 [Gossypium schwendimanii]|uniref:DUF4283 domain-containing protein n=1 Tax=Gossypium schwendimanii TaxID=34291 RepID=A0A7J9MKB0_GOSSC|nr:hypothetical protein [Gossypium schwendimanii]